jgi:heme exporter protein B
MTALLLRDIKLSIRAGGGALIGVLFFLTVVAVIPFGVGPISLLSRIGPAIVWIGALLAALLGLDRLFQAERDDGSLDLMLMQETPLVLTVLVKCLAHWIATSLPLVIASPLLGLFMNMSETAIGATMLTLWSARRPSPSSAPSGRPSRWRCRAAACWSRSSSCR